VQRAARAGLPKSKKARGPNAFEAVASRLSLSDSTVERDFRKFPPDHIDELDPNSPKESEND